MARAAGRKVATPTTMELELPALPAAAGPTAAAPGAASPTLNQLQRQVDDIARRHDHPTPGMATAPDRVLDERVRLRDDEPFGRWLLAQRDRGDWIDDLAAAARQDNGFPRNGTPDDVRRRLTGFGAPGDMFEALDDAERCWESL